MNVVDKADTMNPPIVHEKKERLSVSDVSSTFDLGKIYDEDHLDMDDTETISDDWSSSSSNTMDPIVPLLISQTTHLSEEVISEKEYCKGLEIESLKAKNQSLQLQNNTLKDIVEDEDHGSIRVSKVIEENELQKSHIADLTYKLLDVSEKSKADREEIAKLREMLRGFNEENAKLKSVVKTMKKTIKKKNETIQFFQSQMSKLKPKFSPSSPSKKHSAQETNLAPSQDDIPRIVIVDASPQTRVQRVSAALSNLNISLPLSPERNLAPAQDEIPRIDVVDASPQTRVQRLSASLSNLNISSPFSSPFSGRKSAPIEAPCVGHREGE